MERVFHSFVGQSAAQEASDLNAFLCMVSLNCMQVAPECVGGAVRYGLMEGLIGGCM
jgi:hypothetical protein